MLDLDVVRRAAVAREPFSFFATTGVLDSNALKRIGADFPAISQPGIFPLEELTAGPAFNLLIDEIRGSLARTARLTSARLDGTLHDRMRAGMRKDSPEYAAQNRFLLQLAAIDTDVAYAYTAIEKDGKIWLILDTEPPDGADDMDVMQPYDDAPEDLRTAIREQKARVSAPYTDQWGSFITAYAPFRNRAGAFSGVVGVDLGLASYERRLRPMQQATWAIYIAGSILSLLIGLALWWSYRRSGAVEQLARQLNNVNALLSVLAAS